MTSLDRLALATIVIWIAGAVGSARWGLWFGVGTVAIVLAVVLLILRPELRLLFRTRASALAAGVAAGIVMCAVTYGLYPLLASAVPGMASSTRALYADFQALPPLQAALALGPVILGEEIAWRGLVQSALARRVGPTASVVAAGTLYALAHAPTGSLLLVVVAFICGLYWSALRTLTGGVIAPLVAHVLWDTALLFIWPLPT